MKNVEFRTYGCAMSRQTDFTDPLCHGGANPKFLGTPSVTEGQRGTPSVTEGQTGGPLCHGGANSKFNGTPSVTEGVAISLRRLAWACGKGPHPARRTKLLCELAKSTCMMSKKWR